VHIDGKGQVLVLTEENGDVTEKLPTLVSQLRRIGKSMIVCGELELWRNNKHEPRQATNAIIHRTKIDPDEKNIRLNAFDVVFFDGKDIHKKPFVERIKYLREDSYMMKWR